MTVFPYILEANWEGAATDFDTALTDTQSKSLGYLHFTDSVRRYGVTPYRGAYVWGLDHSVGTKTTGAYQTQAAFNVTDAQYWAVGFALFVKNTTMANANRTSIVKCMAGATDEVCLQLYYTTAGGLQLLLTEANDTAVGTNPATPLSENRWHWVEIHGKKDNGGSNDGTANLVLDGVAIGTVSSLNQGDFTDLYVGAINGDAGHTAGLIFFDEIIATGVDTSSVRTGLHSRYPMNPHVSKSGHLFVGPGTISRVQLLTATGDNILRLYDTDRGTSTGTYVMEAEANSGSASVIEGPFAFERGCYVSVSGTNPRAQVSISYQADAGCPIYGSDANLKSYAFSRRELPGSL